MKKTRESRDAKGQRAREERAPARPIDKDDLADVNGGGGGSWSGGGGMWSGGGGF